MQSQLGGFRGLQCSFATQAVTALGKLAQHKQVSLGLLFVDLRSAFHCLLRQHAFNGCSTFPAHLRRVLEAEGFSAQDLATLSSEHSFVFEQTAGVDLQRHMDQAHAWTWYRLAGSESTFQTERGSRPGSPLADAAFYVAMVSILRQLRDILYQNPIFCDAIRKLGYHPEILTWIDDMCIPVISSAAECLDPALISITNQVVDVLASFGFTVNFSRGKTEAICTYHGRGAPACRRQRFIDGHGMLELHPNQNLRIVASYQHLGTCVTPHFAIDKEVTTRIAKATKVWRILAKSVFAN